MHLILLTDALGRVLETVVSRCQLVRFDPLPAARIAAALEAEGVEPERADACARLALGNAARARFLASTEGAALRADVEALVARRCARAASAAEPWRPLLERAEARRAEAEEAVAGAAASGSSWSRRAASAARSSASSRRPPSATAAARAPRCSTSALDARPALAFRDLVCLAEGAARRCSATDRAAGAGRARPRRATRAACARRPSAARTCASRSS